MLRRRQNVLRVAGSHLHTHTHTASVEMAFVRDEAAEIFAHFPSAALVRPTRKRPTSSEQAEEEEHV